VDAFRPDTTSTAEIVGTEKFELAVSTKTLQIVLYQ
jgi:hypothetical protein